MGSTYTAKLFLRGVRAPIYLSEPDTETVLTEVATNASPAKLRARLSTGQSLVIDIGEIVTAYGPEDGGSTTLILNEAETHALAVGFSYGEGALEDLPGINPKAVESLNKMIRRHTDSSTEHEMQKGDTEDQANAQTWLHQGDIKRAITTAGPDYVAGWLAEATAGPDVRIALKNGCKGLIVGFSDDESGHPSKGCFAVDLISEDEESSQYHSLNDTVGVGIDEIDGVISYDDNALLRGAIEPLNWED